MKEILAKTKIRESLFGKTRIEQANIKGVELAKIGPIEKTRIALGLKEYDVEIIEIKAIDGGVEVFARAWNLDGTRVGFGADGTVEIERFRFFNPPILVADGTFRVEKKGKEDVTYANVKESPIEALIEILAHTISVVAKNGNRVIQGKIGNTTSTFYTNDSGAQDGVIGVAESSSWATVRGATSGTAPDGTDFTARGYVSGGNYSIERGYTIFDTSAIPDTDTITSATVSVWANTLYDSDNDAKDVINVYLFTPASDTAPVAGDFDQFGTTEGSTSKDITAGIQTGTAGGNVNNWALNSTGLTWINKTGKTCIGWREGHDVQNEAYAVSTYTGVRFYRSEVGGTTYGPKLVVEHASSTSIKSVSGVLRANVKSRNGVLSASIKSLNGIT
jgi:hypothetical protein